mgnify:CR=1 FL=1
MYYINLEINIIVKTLQEIAFSMILCEIKNIILNLIITIIPVRF